MKKKNNTTGWATRLRRLMEDKGFNPRSLSLAAGLNATAVRDILEGRAKYPRYDTIESLAKALEITPNHLMTGGNGDKAQEASATASPKSTQRSASTTKPPETVTTEGGIHPSLDDADLALLSEIIATLHEVAENYKQSLKPQDFAAMVTTIYKNVTATPAAKTSKTDIITPIQSLVMYEAIKSSVARKG
ncbi:MAG: XRE family transcriptional regulator [Proteobacteria bacterium]|jgi:transcriptional regulator with XRE-family HTH domain|nr:helix-turn-helix transcriptional regulator [Alphaproteobacteria bacterium]NCC03214.1 XRE family transcriptional regulator [Pseudomonadota bacterium]